MGSADGAVLGITKIVDHGDPKHRWNMVLLGDRYQADQLDLFATDASNFVDTMQQTEPFGDMWPGINIFRIDVSSTDSGADDPVASGATGAVAHTFFDATFGSFGVRRLLTVKSSAVHAVVNNRLPQAHMIMVIVNSDVYGGSGGDVATFSVADNAVQIALHEMGHSAFALADEYEYYLGCGAGGDASGTHDRYAGFEPGNPNITANADRATTKWRDLIDPATPMATTSNADATRCDPQANPLAAGTVGAYEGGGYFHAKLYRPQFTCRMRALADPYCAVCQHTIRKTITRHMS